MIIHKEFIRICEYIKDLFHVESLKISNGIESIRICWESVI